MIDMEWPQYTMLSIYAVSVVINAYQGKERGIAGIFGASFGIGILYMGGFFS